MATKEETIEYLRQRKAAYQMAFEGAHGARVMEDLKRFCFAEKSCFHANPRVTANLEGRREVYLRIQEHCNLSEEYLAELYGAVITPAPTEGEQENA